MMTATGLVWLLVSAATASVWQEACSQWASPTPWNVTLVQATYYPPGALVNASSLISTIESAELPGFCRLQLLISTNPETGSCANTEV